MQNIFNNFLLVYRLINITDTSFEMQLVYFNDKLASFLEENPVFITKNKVVITYLGPRLVLEPRDPHSGRPQGIILPRLQGINSSCTSERDQFTIANEAPRLQVRTSGMVRGEWIFNSFIRFRCPKDKETYIRSLCTAIFDLIQAFSGAKNNERTTVTLIINN
jgi:hypothetical protein